MDDETGSDVRLREGLEHAAGEVRGTVTDTLQDAVLGAIQDGAIDLLVERHGGSAKELKESLKLPWEKTPVPKVDLLQRAKTPEELGIDDSAVTAEQVAEFEKMRKTIDEAD